jgi:arylformamidase
VPKIIDLAYPIEDHFRWKVQRDLAASFEQNDDFQITRVGFAVHGFTHIDAPRHMLPDGPTTSDFRLESLVGEAAILDVSAVAENTAITADLLAAAGEHARPGDRILIKTAWDQRFSLSAPEFWTRAPYLTREACEWLIARRPSVVGFDFPQDYPMRALLDGGKPAMAEFVSHDVILRRGVPLIEYLCNLGAVRSARAEICALPLKLLDADGAPARVIAIER